MKTKKLISIFAVTGLIFSLISCSKTLNGVEDATDDPAVIEKSGDIVQESCRYSTFSGTLTDLEIAGLMKMREEEKLAHDVYVALYTRWNYVVFRNIAKSETAHTSAMLRLINGYKQTDPAINVEGEFNDPLFGNLYAQLIEKGDESLVDALKTGAFIEEYDIADLQNLLAETQNEDVKRVYVNLLAASKIHLRAFSFSLKRLGENYTPTVISAEEYKKILDRL